MSVLDDWESLTQELEARPIDMDSEIVRDDPECPQKYISVAIGCGLGGDGGFSLIEVITGEGREADTLLAKRIIRGLQLEAEEAK